MANVEVTPSVDVAIVMFGGAEHLSACLAALDAQGDVIGTVIVIDNAADNDVAIVVEGRAVTYIRNADNVGYAAAMNQAYALSTAPYLLSLNADCELHAGYVDACVSELVAQPASAAVTGTLRLPNGAIDSTGITVSAAGQARDRDRMRTVPSPEPEPFGVSGAAALWRRTALDSVGPEPWWSWLFVYWDDVEIAWRLRRGGWTFRHVPGATATHQRGSDSASPDFIEAQSLRNRLATLARHKGAKGLLEPRVLAASVATIARLALRHPRALVKAQPFTAVRVGINERRHDL